MAPRQRRPPRVPEKVVQAHIVKALVSVGGVVHVLGTRRPRGDYHGTRQTPGLPDVHAFLPPAPLNPHSATWRELWVEVKAKGGQLSPEQVAFRDHCLLSGVAHVSGDLDALLEWLIVAGYLKPSMVPHYRLPAAGGQP